MLKIHCIAVLSKATPTDAKGFGALEQSYSNHGGTARSYVKAELVNAMERCSFTHEFFSVCNSVNNSLLKKFTILILITQNVRAFMDV
jgi:hypothetical protein